MGNDGKGDGPWTHGNSFANGQQDATRSGWEMRLVLESQETFWRHM